MAKFSGKKILILGGADIHCKLIKAAKELGLYTIVTDYLLPEESPGKQLADKSYMLNIFDIDSIVAMCREEQVDAVLSTSLDPCQRPYQQICERLGLPCYCNTAEQVYKLTDKDAFKACCEENNVDIIPSYQALDASIEFPVLVKPALCRGSKGVTICHSRSELASAVEKAEKQSENGRALIEKYMGNKDDFTVTYFFVEGEAYLIKIGDRFLGTVESGMDRNCIASICPSKYTDMYMTRVNARVVNMLKKLGIKNGPVFLQGFVDGETVRFYDPGFRFPGAEYETMLKQVLGIDFMKIMVEFSLTGRISRTYGSISNDVSLLNHKALGMWLPTIGAGQIGSISGFDKLDQIPQVSCYTVRHRVGDVISNTGDVNQLLCEVDLTCDSLTEYRQVLRKVQACIRVLDVHGNDMIISPFSPDTIEAYAFGRI